MDKEERRLLEEIMEEITDVLSLDDFIRRTERMGVVVPLGKDSMQINLDSKTMETLYAKKNEKLENLIKKFEEWVKQKK